jgi:predicted nuclease of predicted toxin-antitoxin system
MRLLLDNNLSPRLAEVMSKAGWDAVHVAALGLRAEPDTVVMRTAVEDDRVLVSADTEAASGAP